MNARAISIDHLHFRWSDSDDLLQTGALVADAGRRAAAQCFRRPSPRRAG